MDARRAANARLATVSFADVAADVFGALQALDIRAMRNRVVHVYFDVDRDILWDTVHNGLPKLVDPLKRD